MAQKKTIKKKPVKVGAMTNEERDYISQHLYRKSVEEIANDLNRSVHHVCMEAGIDEETLKDFRFSPDYDSLKNEFNQEELMRFEYKYLEWISQFNKNIVPSEKMQVLLAIKYDILMSRCLEEQLKIQKDAKIWEEKMNQVLQGGTLDNQTAKDFQSLAQTIASLRMCVKDQIKSFTDLTGKHKDLMNQLKATRADRVKTAENAKRDFMTLMKSLVDEKFRAEEAEKLEIVRMATNKEFSRLSNPHKYIDGSKDLPILSPETVDKKQENDNITIEEDKPKEENNGT